MNPKLLRELAERCEREEPSWQLDDAIAQAALGLPPCGTAGPPPYTSSLDAAVTLVPCDPANPSGSMLWSLSYDEDGVGGPRAYLAGLGKGYHDPEYIYGHSDKTPALALCAAALKARAAIAEQTEAATLPGEATP